MTPQHHLPADIERTSMGIITAELAARGLTVPPENAAVVKRVIHTTADFDYAENLRFTPGAAAAGVAAMRAGAAVITDTNMALAGITKPGLAKLGGQALCFMADPAVAAAAKAAGSTRAAAAMHRAAREYPGAVLAVTHDRYFLDNVAEWICEVDRGHLYPYKGNYSTYLETKAKRLEIQGAKDAKLAKRLKNELDWVRSSPKARQAKNKARLERYDQMENEARNNKKLDFSEIQIPAGPRLGSTVLEANHIHKAFGERVLIDDLSFTLPRNGIVGVIGPNGVGKSTLFKTIVGLEPLTSGELKIGDTVKISYVDQNREGLDPNKNLWEAVSGGLDFIEVAGVEVPTRAYVASFGFKGADQQKLTGVLSGGERNRLNLALTLKQGGNLLLLDEPTNDLDVETLESLENALLEFPGCAVVISHDRWFLDRVATHILAWEGDDDNPAKWYWFEGNFQAYQENKVARLGEDAARPHRLHKKLVRG